MFNEICIIAPGLLGASILAAVRKRSTSSRLTAWARRSETRDACLNSAWCDAAFEDIQKAVSTADLIIICTPVNAIPHIAHSIAPSIKEGAIITDVGSTKGLICEQCAPLFKKPTSFIGSHPMAGSEKTGFAHADAGLFEGRTCFVTPSLSTEQETVKKLVDFWKSLGSLVCTASPQEHDKIVANVSHLPHIVAASLCNQLSECPPNYLSLSGQGLKDTTRIAAGDADLWKNIIEHNETNIIEALSKFQNEIEAFKQAIQSKDYATVELLLKKAKKCRDQY